MYFSTSSDSYSITAITSSCKHTRKDAIFMELCTYMDDEEDEHSDIDSSATESRKLMKLMCN